MIWILEGGAIVCLLYYGVIVISSGFSTSFALFWPLCAVILGVLAAGYHYYCVHREQIPLWIPVSAVTFFSVWLAVILIGLVLISAGALSSTRQSMDYVIVLGAKVHGDKPGNSLKKRLDQAIAYAEDHPNTFFVLSGGQGPGEEISEAQAMYQYLRYNGVPHNQLLLENQSTSTAENIRNSIEVIERQEEWKDQAFLNQFHHDGSAFAHGHTDLQSVHIAVLTSDFHLFRARGIGKKQGLPGIYGIGAPSDPVLAPHLWIRECFAILKDKFMGNL